MKKKSIVVLIIICLLSCIFSYTPISVRADSGFDSSYDSGGSDWGGSDWSSSDSSWSSSSDYSGSDDDALAIIIAMIIWIGMPFIISLIMNQISNNQTPLSLDHNKEIDDEEVKKYIKNFDRIPFLRDRYNDYLKVQDDWMNFNYDSLRENLSDELYNQYEMQLETLKVKNQQNIMKDFTYIDSMITNIEEENGQITVTVELLVKFIDYLAQDGKTFRGSTVVPITQHYALTFTISKGKLKECPNCGAPLKKSSSQKCSYCGSIITKSGNKIILSKKESLRQR